MGRFAHAIFGLGATLMAWRALEQQWLADQIHDPWALAAIQVGIPAAIALGSVLAIVAGLLSGNPRRAFRNDALSALAAFTGIFVLALGELPRDVVGLVFVFIVAARVAPWAWWAVRHGTPPAYVFALAFAFYAPLVGWRVAASLPYGDQVFYLLSAERLTQGSLDATIDPKRFFELLGVAPTGIDTATHVADAPAGPRLIQGYALPAILTPGWLLGAETGATIVIALFAAWASLQTWLLLSETGPPAAPGALHAERIAWALVTFCAPLALLAVHVYPNAVGAALIVTGYRYAFTARVRRPLLAGALLGATAFLNPRDGLVLLALAPFALAWARSARVQFARGAVALTIAASLVSYLTFGVALPYAGYIFGTVTAQAIQAEPTWNFHFWVGLPAILFDRVFGVAGTAPWLFLAALGAFPAIRHARQRLVPAGTAIVASIALLSLFRLWEGGYAPPNRYLVDVLPLAAPFVAFGLWAARPLVLRIFVAVTVVVSVVATAFLLAVPTAALNTAFDDKPQAMLDAALGLNPLGWLPSFQPVTPEWYVGAYLRLIPAVVLVVALVLLGRRRASA
jgi:hypothetical protein